MSNTASAVQVINSKRLNNGIVEYLVHYAGWNNRYDEWIRRDSIISIVDEPSDASLTNTPAPSMPPSTKSRQISVVGSIISQVFRMISSKKETISNCVNGPENHEGGAALHFAYLLYNY